MKLCEFIMKVPAHLRTPFCCKQPNRSTYFKLTSLKTKRRCAGLNQFYRAGIASYLRETLGDFSTQAVCTHLPSSDQLQ